LLSKMVSQILATMEATAIADPEGAGGGFFSNGDDRRSLRNRSGSPFSMNFAPPAPGRGTRAVAATPVPSLAGGGGGELPGAEYRYETGFRVSPKCCVISRAHRARWLHGCEESARSEFFQAVCRLQTDAGDWGIGIGASFDTWAHPRLFKEKSYGMKRLAPEPAPISIPSSRPPMIQYRPRSSPPRPGISKDVGGRRIRRKLGCERRRKKLAAGRWDSRSQKKGVLVCLRAL